MSIRPLDWQSSAGNRLAARRANKEGKPSLTFRVQRAVYLRPDRYFHARASR
ncbi:MAG: hypothetical protein AB7O38_07015 [Pirellulaceae bacterium]